MSSDRGVNKPLKPTQSLATNRTARSPLTPRLAATGAVASSTKPIASRVTPKTPALAPRVKSQDETPSKDGVGSGNVTPRSFARSARVEIPQLVSAQELPGSVARPKSIVGVSGPQSDKSTTSNGAGPHSRTRLSRPTSFVADAMPSPVFYAPSRMSPDALDMNHSMPDESIDGRFFHASDAPKQEIAQKKIEPKKTPTFFYANGKEDTPVATSKTTSPVIAAISGKRSSGLWTRPDAQLSSSKSPPMLSPPLSALSGNSPYFASASLPQRQVRSPSPSKENIHLSYRKGASQIFGTRPVPRSSASSALEESAVQHHRRPSLGRSHHKSPSLSSIDSGSSPQSRGRSTTGAGTVPYTTASELTLPTHLQFRSPGSLPLIDTDLVASPDRQLPEEALLSPSKAVSDFATDARRERKVLDLEISNRSLLAINASLERELRRQKTELKRFRRLSRAGRISSLQSERSARPSEGLSTLDEDESMDDNFDEFGLPSGLTDLYDISDSEDESSLASGVEPLSPGAQASRDQDRLAKDEKRLRVDLEKHKELLVQSQMMNQSLKRCTYATEEMIREGKKALNYNVRVSDVKLGGRILTGHEDEDDESREIEIEDDVSGGDEDGMTSARGLLDVWSAVGKSKGEPSEVSGDRDSGIEVDKFPAYSSIRSAQGMYQARDSGRPPDAPDQHAVLKADPMNPSIIGTQMGKAESPDVS